MSQTKHQASFCSRTRAFSLIELICVIGIIAVLMALMLPALSHGKIRAQRAVCMNNLKQVAMAFHNFGHEHNNRFPMQAPMSEGGTAEFVQNAFRMDGEFYFSYRHFQAISNELATPKALVCPADLTRSPVTDFANLDSDNLSYFVNAAADYSKPETILAGDRNITSELSTNQTLVIAGTRTPVRWTIELHRFKGNLLFSDGHVELCNSLYLSNHLSARSDFMLPTRKRDILASASTNANVPGLMSRTSLIGVSQKVQFLSNSESVTYSPAASPETSVGNSTGRMSQRDSHLPGNPERVSIMAEASVRRVQDVKPESSPTNMGNNPVNPDIAEMQDDDNAESPYKPIKRKLFAMAQAVDDWPVWPWWLLLILLVAILYLRRRWNQYMQKKMM